MTKMWTGMVCLALLSACGAPTDEQSAEQDENSAAIELGDDGAESADGDLDTEMLVGSLEQGLNEASCGTATVNKTAKISGNGVLPAINPPYGSASCTNAFLEGVNAATPKKATLSMFSQVSANEADCARVAFHGIYFANGSRVASANGVGVFRGGTRCVVGVDFTFDPANTTTRQIAADRVALAGGVPPVAANARFAVQAVNAAGALQRIDIEVANVR